MLAYCYVLYAKSLDSAFRIFEGSDVLDLVRDSDEGDLYKGEVDDMCNADNDLILNTNVEGQDS